MKKRKLVYKKNHFIVSNDTYKQDILFCFNMTGKECLNVLEKEHDNLTDHDREYITRGEENKKGNILGTMYPLERGFVVMLNWPEDSLRENICTASHEIIHVAHYILRNIRIPLEENTEEAYTYLIESILKSFLFKLY